jgi:hypothetical protein
VCIASPSIRPPSTPSICPPVRPPVRSLNPPSLRVPPTVWPCSAPSVWPHPPPLHGAHRLAPSRPPPSGPIRPRQPRRRALSAPSIRPRLLLSTNNYKFFQVFVSHYLSCVRSLKSVASLYVVPLRETHFTRAFDQGSQS